MGNSFIRVKKILFVSLHKVEPFLRVSHNTLRYSSPLLLASFPMLQFCSPITKQVRHCKKNMNLLILRPESTSLVYLSVGDVL